MSQAGPEHVEAETMVVTTEDGVVLTGNRLTAFENRIIARVQARDHVLFGSVAVLFVLMIGLVFFLGRLSNTVHSSDRILRAATGPKAQAQNQAVIKGLLDNMDCQDQKNLQRLVDKLAGAGVIQLSSTGSIVEARCKDVVPPNVVTSTTTTVKGLKQTSMAPTVTSSKRTTTSSTRGSTTTVTQAPSTTSTTRASPSTTTTEQPTTTTTSCLVPLLCRR